MHNNNNNKKRIMSTKKKKAIRIFEAEMFMLEFKFKLT